MIIPFQVAQSYGLLVTGISRAYWFAGFRFGASHRHGDLTVGPCIPTPRQRVMGQFGLAVVHLFTALQSSQSDFDNHFLLLFKV